MANKFRNIRDGLNINVTPASPGTTILGDLTVNGSTSNLQYNNGTSPSDVATAGNTLSLTGKTMDAGSNTFTNFVNANIAAGAAIAYSKLTLTGSIVNADINSAAQISYSKLSLGNSIQASDIVSAAGIQYSKLNLSGGVLNADINPAAAITYSKLSLSGSIQGSDINSAAAISYTKLALGNSILASDIVSAAGIQYTKLSLSNSILASDIASAAAIQYSKLSLANSIQASDIASAAGIQYSKLSLSGSILNADVAAGAAIALTKLATMATGNVLGNLSGSTATPGAVSAVSAATASTVMTRDASANSSVNNLIESFATTVSSASAVTLTNASAYSQQFTGVFAQNVVLPDATTCINGLAFAILNRTTQTTTVKQNGGATLTTITQGTQAIITLSNNGTTAGVWDVSAAGASPLTTKGDIFARDASGSARFGVGTDGQGIVADSSQPTGLRWATQQAGAKNYITYSNFENAAVTGWSMGTVGTLVNGIPTGSPTFGSGQSGNLSLGPTSTNPLAGTNSLSLVSSAATTVGNMFATQAYTIDAEDQAKVLTFKFYYSPVSGASNCNFSGTSSNSFGIAIWDATNSVWLSSTANFGMTQGTGVGYATGTCQTNSNTSSLRFVVYAANATAGACQLLFDDFYLGPQTAPLGAVVTDWGTVPWTPTGSWTTNTTYTGKYRYVGDTAQVQTLVTLTGAPTNTGLTINLPFSIDTAKLTDSTQFFGALPGAQVIVLHAGAQYAFTASYSSPTAIVITYPQTGTAPTAPMPGGQLTSTTPFTWASTDTIDIKFEVPVVGKSSNVQMSSDTDTRVCSFRATKASQTVTADTQTQLTFTSGNVTKDTHGGWSSNQYQAPMSGQYVLTGSLSDSSGSSNYAVIGYKINGGSVVNLATVPSSAIAGALANGSDEISLNSGDIITFWGQVHSTAFSSPTITISKKSGPAVISATESVNARYITVTATTVPTGGATIPFPTKDYDSHNAYNTSTGFYTCPVSGKYRVSCTGVSGSVTLGIGQAWQITANHNGGGSVLQWIWGNSNPGLSYMASGSDTFNCLAGDTLSIVASSSVATTMNTTIASHVTFERVGN